MTIELRSDTFTKPDKGMLDAMCSAEVGDDVFGEDPSVNKLEATAARLFGMEAALFCPTGTMTNQIAIKCHTQQGNEVICENESHVYIYEGGGIAFNSGCQTRPIVGDRGRLNALQIESSINPDDVHKAKTALVSLENTCNRGGGSVYEISELKSIKSVCDAHYIPLHLDGARLFNALVATGQKATEYGEIFDSISICLSKGLGTPLGSLLLGNFRFIKQARRIRKVMGGGMRQAGYIAAAGLYALENNIERLADDHKNAKAIAHALLKKDFVGQMLPIETNIIIFEIKGFYTPITFCEKMAKHQVLCLPISKTSVRMVTHLDVTGEMVEELIAIINGM